MTNVSDFSNSQMDVKKQFEQDEMTKNEKTIEVAVDKITNFQDQADSPQDWNCNSDFTFDNVIGHLEDMLIDEEFYKLQNSFLEKYWEEFDNNDENKHSYMLIFNEYTNKIEKFIVSYLEKRVKNFEMDRFASELEKRKNNLEGEIFEVLLTLSDFKAFKDIFLDYRAMKEGHTIDLGKSLCVSSVPL